MNGRVVPATGQTASTSGARPKAIFLMGPTAAGKTGVALALADQLPVGLISVDSGQVYRGMDIGTAKLSPQLLRRYPHALIDIRDPAEPYSADDFRHDALEAMAAITAAGRIPLLVGGTMFYYRVLQAGLPALPPANAALREALEREGREAGWPAMHMRLAAVDPPSARRIDRNDRQRIVRALEIHALTGEPASSFRPEADEGLAYEVIKVGIWPAQRRVLHQRIAQRLEEMFAEGFIDEVRRLSRREELDASLPAMRAVGYRQVLEYLRGDTTYEIMRERCLAATRQLAKRQLTWLRHDPDIVWFDTECPGFPGKVLEFICKRLTV